MIDSRRNSENSRCVGVRFSSAQTAMRWQLGSLTRERDNHSAYVYANYRVFRGAEA
jgi:hypothetical protein